MCDASRIAPGRPKLDDAPVAVDTLGVASSFVIVRRVNSAREPDSSFGGVPVVNCLGVVHMEEEVEDRVQVEVEREEQGVGETHGKEQGE